MSENVRTALITATAVLFGGLIAGGASIITTVVTQDNENERVERRVDEEARGAARVLFDHFITVGAYMELNLQEGEIQPLIHDLAEIPLPAGDLKLVSARLSPGEFTAVEGAMGLIQPYIATVEAGEGQALSPGSRATMRGMADRVEDGAAALLGVADLPAAETDVSADVAP